MSTNWPENCQSDFLVELSNALRNRSKAFGAWTSKIESAVEMEKVAENAYERFDIVFWPALPPTPALNVSFWEDKEFVIEARGTAQKAYWQSLYRIEGRVGESTCGDITELLLESIQSAMHGSLDRVKENWERI